MTSSSSNRHDHSIWIGIDLGTSNCTCAVWDSTRGGAKWMRLDQIAMVGSDNGDDGERTSSSSSSTKKWGRIVPSIVVLSTTVPKERLSDTVVNVSAIIHHPTVVVASQQEQLAATILARVGQAALSYRQSMLGSSSKVTWIQSVKRILGKRLEELDADLVHSLPFDIVQERGGELKLKVVMDGRIEHNDDDDDAAADAADSTTSPTTTTTLLITPVQVMAILLYAIRCQGNRYLQTFATKKHLQIPGEGSIHNVVVGVPAHFSVLQKQLVEQACRLAGFEGHISTLLESTAAAMAYGLAFNNLKLPSTSSQSSLPLSSSSGPMVEGEQIILVVDMGGGTTDVTIAKRNSEVPSEQQQQQQQQQYQVLVTEGNGRLGGDDMDQALFELCRTRFQLHQPTLHQRQALLQSCRRAKEALTSALTATVTLEHYPSMTISRDDFEASIEPWLQKARMLIQTALQRLSSTTMEATNNDPVSVTEVVLVGGTTRVPAVRRMLHELFPSIELCTSLHPMGSVAQGLAIQAALESKLVPLHELQSALMLDCIPHAIGVKLDDGSFCPILARNAKLPAIGHVTFTLATKDQPGVTISAVEQISDTQLEPMSRDAFTFLLHRLTPQEFEKLSQRTIEVGMKVDTDGKFIVSIYDALDPEHVRKRRRLQQLATNDEHKREEVMGELGYISDLVMAEVGYTSEQIWLLIGCVVLFVIYIAVKIAFAEDQLVLEAAQL